MVAHEYKKNYIKERKKRFFLFSLVDFIPVNIDFQNLNYIKPNNEILHIFTQFVLPFHHNIMRCGCTCEYIHLYSP